MTDRSARGAPDPSSRTIFLMREVIEGKRFLTDPAFRSILDRLRSGEERIRVSGVYGSARALLIAILYRNHKKTFLVAAPTEDEARSIARDASLFLPGGDVLLYPPWDLLGPDIYSTQADVETARGEVLAKLLLGRPAVVVAPANALLQRIPPADSIRRYIQTVSIGDALDRDAFLKKLDEGGYRRVSLVEGKG